MGRARVQTWQSSSSIYILDHCPMLNYNVSLNPTVTHKYIYWLAHFEDKQNEIQRRQEIPSVTDMVKW